MERRMEFSLWCTVVLLAFALLCCDAPPTPVLANDSAGKQAAVAPRGSYFLIDTDNQWIGLYTQQNNSGPRLVSAQNYQYALVLASMSGDSAGEGCETPAGWNVVDTRKALDARR